ncbi:MAG: thioester reductase domain-containing protein [Proteobacteria bacterium]|nr:thioester reductase domain-containing protein [Pseudomonadota bacterium]
MAYSEMMLLLENFDSNVSIGAINSPTSVTLSGNTSELNKIALLLDKKNVFNRFLKVEVPYHSPAMDLITPDLELSLSELKPKKAQIPIVSTVTSDFIDGKEFDASYWVKNVRQPVLFQKALNTLIESKHSVFIEISAHPVLSPSIREVINENCGQKLLFHSVKRNLGSSQNIQKSVAELYVSGYPIKWRKIYPKYSGRLVFLPNYPFQRERYWNESKISELFRTGKDHHPVLGNKSDSGLSSWTKVLDIEAVEFFKEHSVQNELVYPAAAYVEMIRTAAKAEYNSAVILIEDLKLTSPIVLEVDSQTFLNLNFESNNRISIHSKKSSESDRWSQNANGSVLANLEAPKVPVLNIDQLIQKFNTRLTKSDVYQCLKERGLNYGKSFRLVQELWKNNQCGIGKISIEEENHKENNEFNVQVTVLDSCFHILELIPEEGLYLPTQFKRIFLESAITKVNWAFCKITGRNENTIEAEVLLYNDSGKMIAHFQQSLFTRVDRKSQTTFQTIEKNLFNYQWILQKNSHFIPTEHKSPSLSELPSLTIEPQARFDRLSKEFGIEKLRYVVEKQLDDLCLQYIVNTFYKLGIPIKQGTIFNPTVIIQDNHIINHFKNLFLYLVSILEKYEVLAQKNDQWEVKSEIPSVDTNREWSLLIADHPILQAELFLLFKCGNHLHDILKGKQSPLNIIYSSKTTFVEHLYQHSPVIRIYNTLLKETVLDLVETSESRRKLKILEIGAGTGSLSSYLLPVLSVKEIEYTYTDIAPNLLSHAREKFSKYKFVDYRTLDITRSPTEQGLTENSYDIVVSSLTLHATPDLEASIGNIKELLSSNGTLVILEITKNPFWLDVIFGTLKGWWSFTDGKLRPDHPIIGTNSWHSLLKKEGFSEIEILKDQKDRYVEHAVIVAKNHEPLANSASNYSNRESSDSSFNESNNQRWIIVHENSETAHNLTSHLSDLGFDVLEATAGSEILKKDDNLFEVNLLELQQLNAFFKHISQISLQPPNVIFVPDLRTIEHYEIGTRPEKKANHNCQKFLFIIQALMQQDWLSHPKFWLITHNARIIKKDEIVNIVQAPLEGMRRVVANEYPGLDSWAIDLSDQHDEKEINLLITEILHFSNDDEIALRGNERYVNRLYPHIPNGTEGLPNHEVFLSKNGQRQNHDSFYQEYKQTDPEANEVQVVVRSASLNLNDLDYSKLETPNQTTQSGYGREFSGFITKVGHECEDYMPGQEVFGICHNACSSTVNVNLKNIAFKPNKLSHFAASAIPSSFICASHILKYLLPIQNIKTILITNATDEIGLAFLQLLKSTDINIHVTADTDEKLNYLKALGIENIGLIGDEEFLKMLASKSGKSLDAIINISDKQLSEAELSLLPPYRGHLIQISQKQKSNTFAHKDLPQGISLQIINPLDLINSLDNEIGILLKEISSNIDSGKIYSFPFRLFNVNEHQAAIEYLKNPNRIGKTCLLINEHPVESKPFTAPVNIDPKMAYLIVGGLKGFGLATAEWLVSEGARYLILISRQGPNNKECIAKIRELEHQGAKIVAESADIADEESINRVFQKIETESIPLAGIIHSAMVLDIALIANMSADQLNKVLSPKITGSWNLYKLSKPYALDFFIFYSSMTTTLGFSGQANYAAGNSFCNAMAHFMRMQGINAYSFCWGLIDEAGWVARHDEARSSVEQSGFYTQSLDQVWQTIQYGLSNNIVELNASPIEWSIAGKYMPTILKTARLSHFLEETSDESKTKNDEKNDNLFKFSLDHNLTIETIATELINDLSQSLGIEKEGIEKDYTLGSLNFDSLIAVELGLKIKNKFEVDIPKVLLLQENLLIEELGEMIQKEIFRRISNNEIKSNEENVKFQPTVKVDLLAETCLPDDIIPSSNSIDLSKGPSKVLLTGATGFLGAYLLHQLINTTQLEIICLVRPKSPTPVDERVYDNLTQYGLWKEEYKERIRVIKSDLSQPRLGLSETVWSELARTVDVIYHNGSWLNFAQPYAALKPTNVDGTKEMLKLACENTTKPFHYISTLIKISQTSADPDRIARQGFSHDEPTAYNSGYVQRNGFNIGYHQSKWVAEELVLEAENRGLPTTIYRPSLIAADSRSGLWNKNDYICLLLKGCMEIGMAPDQDLFFDFCPVDYISQAIVYLSQQAGSLGNNYLLKNPNPIKWNDLIRWLAANVSKIDLVSPEYWLNSVQSNIEKNENSSLYGLLTLFEIRPLERIIIGSPPYILSPGIIEKNITRRALKPSIVCPPVDDRLLKKYFQDFKKRMCQN